MNINRVSFDIRNGEEIVVKSRTSLSWILIAIGNSVFRLRRAPVRVLYTSQWIQWEFRLHQLAVDDSTEPLNQRSRVLTLKKIPGRKLSELLSQCQADRTTCLAWIGIATKSLYQFHQLQVDSGRAGPVHLSHGDASIQNVLIDEQNRTATWFDFDLQHDLNKPETLRHADDLRALLFTSACQFELDHLDEVVKTMKQNYPNPGVWTALQDQVSSRWFRLDVFHASQVRRSRSQCGSPESARPLISRIHFEILAALDRYSGLVLGE